MNDDYNVSFHSVVALISMYQECCGLSDTGSEKMKLCKAGAKLGYCKGKGVSALMVDVNTQKRLKNEKISQISYFYLYSRIFFRIEIMNITKNNGKTKFLIC